MNHYKSGILIFILFMHFCILCGCAVDLVAPDNNINGVIYDNNGFEFYRNNWPVRISAGEFPIAYIYQTPLFSLSVVSKPYDLVLTFPYDTLYYEEPSVIKYKEISTNSPKIVDAGIVGTPRVHGFDAYIHFPPLVNNKLIFYKFISDANFLQENFSHYAAKGTENAQLVVFIPSGNNVISGRVFYLEATLNEINGEITSYDKFGIKDLTLRLNQTHEIFFSDADLAYNPPEVESNVTVNFPQNSRPKVISVNLGAPSFNIASELTLFRFTNFTSNVIVPKLPGNEFKLKLYSAYGTSYNLSFSEPAEKWVYFEPGENAFINHNDIIQVLSPEDNTENVTENTVFEITDNSEAGIYSYDILRPGKNIRCIRLITTSKKLMLKDFIVSGFEYQADQEYIWKVKKYLGYNSMDEFVSGIYTTGKHFSVLSKGRIFKTAPITN